MFIGKTKNITLFLSIVVSLLFWTCSPKISHDVQSFLFDGVPDIYEVEVGVINDSLKRQDSTNVQSLSRMYAARNEFNLHEPYQKRECSSCHDRNKMGKTKLPTPELCYECHDNFNETYEVLHAPVAAGNCLECHNPHQSKLKNLLIQKGQDLCLNCHEESQIVADKIHNKIDDESCITCHSAHGGNNNFSLQSGSCYECHDNFEKEYKFLHAPVASDNCAQCHSSHKTNEPNLLINTTDELCLTCHDTKEFYQQDYHEAIKDKNCSSCHDPHGGSNKSFIFN